MQFLNSNHMTIFYIVASIIACLSLANLCSFCWLIKQSRKVADRMIVGNKVPIDDDLSIEFVENSYNECVSSDLQKLPYEVSEEGREPRKRVLLLKALRKVTKDNGKQYYAHTPHSEWHKIAYITKDKAVIFNFTWEDGEWTTSKEEVRDKEARDFNQRIFNGII